MAQPIARIGDYHVCPMYDGKTPHVGGPIVQGSPNVMAGGVPVARVGDMAMCMAGGPDSIVQGAPTVRVNGQPAAVLGSMTAHGGVVIVGMPNVLAG